MTAPEAAGLVEQWTPLAMKIASRYSRECPWLRDDMLSDAAYAMWRAAYTWDPERAAFSTWATRYIRGALLYRLRTERRQNPAAFAPQFVATGKRDLSPLDRAADSRHGPAEAAEIALDAAPLLRALDALPERQRDVVRRRVMLDQKFDQIAAAHGMSRSNAQNVLSAALDTIQANH